MSNPFIPSGKWLFGWQQPYIAGGEIEAIVNAAVDLGLTGVSFKVASGVFSYPFEGDILPLRNAFRDAGILFYGWHYVYGANNPLYEANLASQRIEELDLDGYEIDAEKHYKNYSNAQALDLMGMIKNHTDTAGIPLGITSYRFPTLHPEFPWMGFLTHPDYFIPQVYWQPPTISRGPVPETNEAIRQWNGIVEKYSLDEKPFVPAGRLYIGDGYPSPGPPPDEVTQFLDHAKSNLELSGVTFWSFDNLYTHMGGADRYEALKAFPWGGDTEPPPDPDPEFEKLKKRVEALELVTADHENRITENRKLIDELIGGGSEPKLINVTAVSDVNCYVWDGEFNKACEGQNPPGAPIMRLPEIGDPDRLHIESGTPFDVNFENNLPSCTGPQGKPHVQVNGGKWFLELPELHNGRKVYARTDKTTYDPSAY